MKKIKRSLWVIAFFIFILSMCCFGASALEATGQCGDNVYWNFDESTGVLIISGEGEMWNSGWNESPFYSADIKAVYVNENVNSVGDSNFYNSGISELYFSDTVKKIGEAAFYGSVNLKKLTLPDSIVEIDDGAFMFCELLSDISLSNALTSIGKMLFYECVSLKDIKLPAGVACIEEAAFGCCCNLESIVIPEAVERIDASAFFCCENLKYVYYYGSEEQWDRIEIDVNNECLKDAIIYFNYTEHMHEYQSEILVESTCRTEGKKKNICSCGCYYYENTDIVEHCMSEWSLVCSATCMSEGQEKRECVYDCGYTEFKTIPITEHKDDNADNICDICGKKIKEDCSCNCHKSGFMGFIWKILRFFYKLFKTNSTCTCGIAHY